MDYQVIARKYRPKRFSEVVGQQPIVQTLMSALKKERLAHAYLFSGAQGTGKTTLARLLAKALNCSHPDSMHEPCNECSCCKEIAAGTSIDVLEIDGASHRGIEDVRQINETTCYAPTHGKYKIYLIDEVHMLTKEAFNALLKTLEEPPEKVKFFFATTEPHKIPETILSRCQRFNLQRIPLSLVQQQLAFIAKDLGAVASDEALHMIAERTEGSMRDAQSLLDQVTSFGEGNVTEQNVATVLGTIPKEKLFALCEAGPKANYAVAFELAAEVHTAGTSISYFLEELTSHFRIFLLMKSGGHPDLPPALRTKYQSYLTCYTEEQCLDILDILRETQASLKFALSSQVFLEMVLIRILRTHQKMTLDALVSRLISLEENLRSSPPAPTVPKADTFTPPVISNAEPVHAEEVKKPSPISLKADTHTQPATSNVEPLQKEKVPEAAKTPSQAPSPTSLKLEEKKPTPSPAPISEDPRAKTRDQSRYDTLMRFAAKELGGSLKTE